MINLSLVPGDSFLGRIEARYVPPPHTTVKKRSTGIAKVENTKDSKSTSLFLTTPYSGMDLYTTQRRVKVKGTRLGLRKRRSIFNQYRREKKRTYVTVIY